MSVVPYFLWKNYLFLLSSRKFFFDYNLYRIKNNKKKFIVQKSNNLKLKISSDFIVFFFRFFNLKEFNLHNPFFNELDYQQKLKELKKSYGESIVNEMLSVTDHKKAPIARMRLHLEDDFKNDSFQLINDYSTEDERFKYSNKIIDKIKKQ